MKLREVKGGGLGFSAKAVTSLFVDTFQLKNADKPFRCPISLTPVDRDGYQLFLLITYQLQQEQKEQALNAKRSPRFEAVN